VDARRDGERDEHAHRLGELCQYPRDGKIGGARVDLVEVDDVVRAESTEHADRVACGQQLALDAKKKAEERREVDANVDDHARRAVLCKELAHFAKAFRRGSVSRFGLGLRAQARASRPQQRPKDQRRSPVQPDRSSLG